MFQPVLPLSGYAGWRFLERTLEVQQAAFVESPSLRRDTDAFREKIGGIRTAEDLVNDRQLLSVALGAFGLDDDIDNRFLIRKVLEDGYTKPEALGNRLSDSRYGELARAFGFGEGLPPRTGLSFFADEIIDRYETKQFERAVGDQDNSMRLALNLAGGLNDVLGSTTSTNARWFSVMGSPPLRAVFETALGFPSSFGSLDVDQQLEQFKSRAEATFGTSDLAEISSDENREKLIRLYMIRNEIASNSASSSGSIALALLSQPAVAF